MIQIFHNASQSNFVGAGLAPALDKSDARKQGRPQESPLQVDRPVSATHSGERMLPPPPICVSNSSSIGYGNYLNKVLMHLAQTQGADTVYCHIQGATAPCSRRLFANSMNELVKAVFYLLEN